MKKSEITASVGAIPPPDAPVETAMPLTAEALAVHRAAAAANERPLKPFAPSPRPVGPPPAALSPKMVTPTAVPPVATQNPELATLIEDVFGAVPDPAPAPPELVANEQADVDQLVDVFPGVDELPPLTDEDRARMPAASNSDGPARGILLNLTPPPEKEITGGFGDLGDAQYFPMTGSEILELSKALIDDLVARIENDLRFSMALTYPRVRVTASLLIEGHAEDGDAGFEVTKIHQPKSGEAGSTPVEVARQHGDEIVFMVTSKRQEFTPNGDQELPPDAIRAELGLPRPHKRMIENPSGAPSWVDVIPGQDVMALTGGGR